MSVKSQLPVVQYDAFLQPFANQLKKRYQRAVLKELELRNGKDSLQDICNNYLYYGLHETDDGFVFREKAPNAQKIYIYGDFSYWKIEERFALHPLGNGDWEISLPKGFLRHGMLYKLWMVWRDGADERIPTYVRRVVQDEQTKIFSAQVWTTSECFQWQYPQPVKPSFPLVYEAHIGMSSGEAKISSYLEFEKEVLPRIKSLGFNTIQLMAIQEHPYYGSFGYQVSNLFAPSSRFGTPEELKHLIDAAHGMDVSVVLDVVHSHSVMNEKEGLSRFDGSYYLYFHDGERGQHPVWNSRCFNYAKNDTLLLLLSNLKYWLEEFHFDGFRFDGITSMCYKDHGIGVDFLNYAQYFDENVDEDALIYLYLANQLVHQVNPQVFTIAEDVSGIPALAFPIKKQGMGFDYRMSMGIADYWVKMVKKVSDEGWNVGEIYYRLTDKRAEEHVIGYVESHDQAMVGDQTLIFRLIGDKMYHLMSKSVSDIQVDRGIALYKLIYFNTLALSNGGYLNFMGNEFGHPEWIDFPREGNQWSFQYARRQWNLADNPDLKYHCLYEFSRAMVQFIKSRNILEYAPIPLVRDEQNQILAFERGDFIFCFNYNPQRSFENYIINCKSGKYKICLNGDKPAFGGFNRIDEETNFFSQNGCLKVYLPARTLFVLEKID